MNPVYATNRTRLNNINRKLEVINGNELIDNITYIQKDRLLK